MTAPTLSPAPMADRLAAEATSGRVTANAVRDYLHAGQVIAAARRCLVCGGQAGDMAECDGCTIQADVAAIRREDV
ncbi:hypothetical protein ACWKSP_26225 [Micromonosporaceae bacterium Da 78-11]